MREGAGADQMQLLHGALSTQSSVDAQLSVRDQRAVCVTLPSLLLHVILTGNEPNPSPKTEPDIIFNLHQDNQINNIITIY